MTFLHRSLICFSALNLLYLSEGAGNPHGPSVVSGEASFSELENILKITAGDKAIINWKGFSVDIGEIARFVQPGSKAVVLNRVTGGEISKLLGTLESNGTVYLINPQGIIFGKDSIINVGGLVASSHALSNEDFLNGKELVFEGDSSAGVINYGTIRARDGDVILLGRRVDNEGTINASGTVALAAGREILLQPEGKPLLLIRPSEQDEASQIHQVGRIEAEGSAYPLAINHTQAKDALNIVYQGGKILLSATGAIESSGELIASSGEVRVESAAPFTHTGTIDVSGEHGGSIFIETQKCAQSGKLLANPDGEIFIQTEGPFIETANGYTSSLEGKITVSSGESGRLFTSGSYVAKEISLLGNDIAIVAAQIDASGEMGGGSVLIGGDLKGANPSVLNAQTTYVNGAARIKADARVSGDGGKIVVWADGKTEFYGTATAAGGALSGNGGMIEVSGKEELIFQGVGSAPALHGAPGTLLLDPKNLTIDSVNGIYPQFKLVDPNEGNGSNFGSNILVLSTGNIVVSKVNDNFAATNSGAVYLYNGQTGALISTLRGSSSGDLIGNGLAALTGNGNFVTNSTAWTNAGVAGAGAVTWINGTTGLNGSVSSSNSLVGSTTNDNVGVVNVLTNGNYVVRSLNWDNGATANVGAVTWGSGSAGVTGAVSSANSLIGSTAADQIGSGGLTPLTNGNYVIGSPNWDNGATANVGASTWASGTTATTGTVSGANSYIGSTANDNVGTIHIALTNGNYVTSSATWDNGATVNVGAVTWGNGTTGSTGVVAPANSLIGTTANDGTSLNLTALQNGNYLSSFPRWDNGATTDVGASVLCNGTSGTTGTVTLAGSLHGTTTSDQVGSLGAVALPNGNYVVRSSNWNNGAATMAGAATFCSGNLATPTTGAVSSANSLVGSHTSDFVGTNPPTVLTNGNYVVFDTSWDSGAVANAGHATWGSTTTGVSGVITSANSLIGSVTNDQVGAGVVALTNGNYIVRSPSWNNGATTTAGAVTWANGTTGLTGTVTAANSLIGTTIADQVGTGAVALPNGNYVVTAQNWDNGATVNVGAVRVCNGTTGTTGTLTTANSLVGSTANDVVGSGGVNSSLTTSNFAVLSPSWHIGATAVGAVTLCDAAGLIGTVNTQNSVVGSVVQASAPTVTADNVNNTFVVRFRSEDTSGRVSIALQTTSQLTYSWGESQAMTIQPSFITPTLNAGTALVLQANNDFTLSSPLTVSAAGAGGNLTISAGRSVAINANITTDNGSLSIIGNDLLASGVVDAYRDAGNATITVGAGSTINTGNGTLSIDLKNGAGKTFSASGDVTLAAGSQLLANNGSISVSSINGISAPGATTLQTSGSGTLTLTATNGDISLGIGSQLTAANGNLLISSGHSLTTVGAATIHTTGSGTVTLIVDTLFPTSPLFGTGAAVLPGATLATGGGTLRIYTADRTLNTMPGTINGSAYVPGTLFVDSTTEQWGIYYPSGSGGVPFKIFYKNTASPTPPTPPSPGTTTSTPSQLRGSALGITLNKVAGTSAEQLQEFTRFSWPQTVQYFNAYDYSMFFFGIPGYVANPWLSHLFAPRKPQVLE